jgi:hypothetical protein
VGTFNSVTEVSIFTPSVSATPTVTPTPSTPTPTPTPTTPPTGCLVATAGGGWVNRSSPGVAGTFAVSFDATPSGGAADAVVGLSQGPQTAHTGFAMLVSFSSTGNIVARNGGSYTAQTTVPWTAGTSYHFTLSANVTTHTYSISVRPTAGGTSQTIGTNFAFRTEQAGVTSINNYGAVVGSSAGTLQVCNYMVAVP